jgi:hypothetical protein
MAPKDKPEKRANGNANNLDIGPILEQLSVISRCLSTIALRLHLPRPKTDTDKIIVLGSLGFSRNEIAQLLELDPHIVSVRLSEHKKATMKRHKPNGKN